MTCETCGGVASDDPNQRPTPDGMTRVLVLTDVKFIGAISRSLYGKRLKDQHVLIEDRDVQLAVQASLVKVEPLPLLEGTVDVEQA